MRIALFTSGRQDWGILAPVARAIVVTEGLELVLVVGGLHLRDQDPAVFVLAQAAAPLLQRSPAASMLLIGSIYGVLAPQWSLYEGTAMCNPAAYNASKGGLIQMGRYLASTLAPVRVNCISPGGVARGQAESFQARYVERTPLKRMAREEDFKGAVAYLAGDAAGYVTGQNLLVDGGWSAW